MNRIEKDYIGEREVPLDVLYGIHSLRAKENFPDITPFHVEWYRAVGQTKSACYQTYSRFKQAAIRKLGNSESPIKFIDDSIIIALQKSAEGVANGKYFENFIVPAIQGGAGTSINMNINEIICNAALISLGYNPGDYHIIDPVEHANIYQSTNDVIPTSLTVAAIKLLDTLENEINSLRAEIEKTEKKYRHKLRIAYTQMQAAVPSSYGNLFSTYNDALSRDWWRVSKCFERIKTVNIGGSAIGTSVTVPRFFVLEVVSVLQQLTGLPITRAENLHDATTNLDSIVEVHAILKSHAVNLQKIVSDIRLLSSDIITDKEVSIPIKQVGSSIMPGKINPVIPEFVISIARKIYANDVLISSLSADGCLDLNAYIPLIGHSLLESIQLLIAADKALKDSLFTGIKIDDKKAAKKLFESPSITTALCAYIGYNKAAIIAKEMKVHSIDIFTANRKVGFIEEEKLRLLLKPENLLKQGFSLNEL